MHTFEGIVHAATPRAFLFQSHYWCAPQWLPFSQTTLVKEHKDEVVIKIAGWLANKNGFVEFTEMECPTEEDEQ